VIRLIRFRSLILSKRRVCHGKAGERYGVCSKESLPVFDFFWVGAARRGDEHGA